MFSLSYVWVLLYYNYWIIAISFAWFSDIVDITFANATAGSTFLCWPRKQWDILAPWLPNNKPLIAHVTVPESISCIGELQVRWCWYIRLSKQAFYLRSIMELISTFQVFHFIWNGPCVNMTFVAKFDAHLGVFCQLIVVPSPHISMAVPGKVRTLSLKYK